MADLFIVEYHHGGCILNNGWPTYIGGTVTLEENVDEDETSLLEVEDTIRKLGYGGSFRVWCRMHPRMLYNGLKLLSTDKDVYEAFVDHRYCRRVVLYVEHLVDHVEVVDNEEEGNIGSSNPNQMEHEDEDVEVDESSSADDQMQHEDEDVEVDDSSSSDDQMQVEDEDVELD